MSEICDEEAIEEVLVLLPYLLEGEINPGSRLCHFFKAEGIHPSRSRESISILCAKVGIDNVSWEPEDDEILL